MPESTPQPSQKPNQQPAHTPRTRLAPSPTGALHLGNARTFLLNWALARRHGWRIVLRIEDLDGPRIKPGADADARRTLEYLGLDWDEGPVVQSADLAPYTAAMHELARAGAAFPSPLSRKEIEAAASAPHGSGPAAGEVRFPPELRPDPPPEGFTFDPDDDSVGWRLRTAPGPVRFGDRFAGPQAHDPHATVGDFVVWTKRRQPAYQLAVVVDDARQGIDRVVRGDDLLDSTARQVLVARALGLHGWLAKVEWTHLPLVLGADGRRLAKRHGDTRLTTYRERGVPGERVVGLVAWWSGAARAPEPMTAAELADRLDPGTIPRTPVTFTERDERWLTSGGSHVG